MAQPAPSAAAQVRLSEAAEAWDRIKDATSISLLERFITRYKDTFYAEMAQARVEDLKKQQVTVATPPPPSAPKPTPSKPAAEVTPTPPPVGCDGVETLVANERRCLKPGAGKTDWFRDCPTCPEMVVAPAGRFTMGSPEDEPDRSDNEDQISVAISKAFAVGRFAVTRGEFRAFVAATGHKAGGGCRVFIGGEWKQADRDWRSPGFSQTDRHPVVCVNWNDAKTYVAWLSRTTGKAYRLLSEAEREYVARADTATPFWWGSAITPAQANYDGAAEPYKGGGSRGEWRKATVPVDSFASNPWGLYNVHGNVREWTGDCWSSKNSGNPGDATARASGDCGSRVLRGAAWNRPPKNLRSANRSANQLNYRHNNTGFRVARTL
jgi:formylglycine-generating enzyme required for sulfatase activity